MSPNSILRRLLASPLVVVDQGDAYALYVTLETPPKRAQFALQSGAPEFVLQIARYAKRHPPIDWCICGRTALTPNLDMNAKLIAELAQLIAPGVLFLDPAWIQAVDPVLLLRLRRLRIKVRASPRDESSSRSAA